jgi:hypothetical protein
MSSWAQPSLERPLDGLSGVHAKNEASMARLGALIRATGGASRELADLRRRARRLQAKNARLRREIERLHCSLGSRPDGPEGQRATARAG